MADEVCTYCIEGRAGCFCGTLADVKYWRERCLVAELNAGEAHEVELRLEADLQCIEEALREYFHIPEEIFIGKEDLAARVTWLVRQVAMLERSEGEAHTDWVPTVVPASEEQRTKVRRLQEEFIFNVPVPAEGQACPTCGSLEVRCDGCANQREWVLRSERERAQTALLNLQKALYATTNLLEARDAENKRLQADNELLVEGTHQAEMARERLERDYMGLHDLLQRVSGERNEVRKDLRDRLQGGEMTASYLVIGKNAQGTMLFQNVVPSLLQVGAFLASILPQYQIDRRTPITVLVEAQDE